MRLSARKGSGRRSVREPVRQASGLRRRRGARGDHRATLCAKSRSRWRRAPCRTLASPEGFGPLKIQPFAGSCIPFAEGNFGFCLANGYQQGRPGLTKATVAHWSSLSRSSRAHRRVIASASHNHRAWLVRHCSSRMPDALRQGDLRLRMAWQ